MPRAHWCVEENALFKHGRGPYEETQHEAITLPMNSASYAACCTLATPRCQLGAAQTRTRTKLLGQSRRLTERHSRIAGASLQPEPLGSAVLHSICLLKAGLHMRGCRHPAQEHKQHHAKICNEKTGVWPPPGRRIRGVPRLRPPNRLGSVHRGERSGCHGTRPTLAACQQASALASDK